VSFDVVSIPFDDPTPIVAGGSPYGYVEKSLGATGGTVDLDRFEAFFYEATSQSATAADNKLYLPEASNFPTGGPHFTIAVDSASSGSFTVLTLSETTVGTISAGQSAQVFIKENSLGQRSPVLLIQEAL
jgi:hypothetical protein